MFTFIRFWRWQYRTLRGYGIGRQRCIFEAYHNALYHREWERRVKEAGQQ